MLGQYFMWIILGGENNFKRQAIVLMYCLPSVSTPFRPARPAICL